MVACKKKLLFTGEFVAQFKYTMIMMPNGPLKLTGLPFDSNLYKTDKSVQDEELKVCFCINCKSY